MTQSFDDQPAINSARELYEQARQQDPDRAFCTIFAPSERRPALLALLLLYQEFARIPEQSSEPILAMMRLQWWRDAIFEGKGAHPYLEILRPAFERELNPEDLLALLDAREEELDYRRPNDLDELEKRVRTTAGTLQRLQSSLIGSHDPLSAELAGTAYGLVGVARSYHFLLERNRNPLPANTNHEIAIGSILTRAKENVAKLRSQSRPQRPEIAPLLPATIAEIQASFLERAGINERNQKMRTPVARLLWAAWRRKP